MAIDWRWADPVIGLQPITETSTTKNHDLGTIARGIDRGSNADGFGEFIYLTGLASTAATDWVAFDEAGATTRLIAGGKGRVAVAMSANVASQYGWYQISGNALAKAETAVATDSALFAGNTVAQVQDDAVDGDYISGAMSRSANTSGSVADIVVELNRPMITQAAGATS